MIKSFKPIEGLVKKLKLPEINFREDFNIILGGNGIGKSVLLNTLAYYMFVPENKGWNSPENTAFKKFRDFRDVKETFEDFSKSISSNSPLGQAEIDLIGCATFYMSSDKLKDSVGNFYEGQDSFNSSFSLTEILQNKVNKLSSGQSVCEYLLRIKDQEVLDLNKYTKQHNSYNERWQQKEKFFLDYLILKGYKKENKPILLLDELDVNLDYENAYFFHNNILKSLSEKYQVICVSHNPFSLLNKEHVIDLDNSIEKIQNLLKQIK